MLPLEPTGCGGVTGGLTGDSGVFSGASPPKIPLSAGIENGKKRPLPIFPIFSSGFPPRGLTIGEKCAKLQMIKGCEEDTRFGKML